MKVKNNQNCLCQSNKINVKICKQTKPIRRKMVDSVKSLKTISTEPQCQHFVVRKKRLCRMTVRPGLQFCGEHDPQPRNEDGKTDKRIPCPNDPKHTCYVSKLEKHLVICNARKGELPTYMVANINAPAAVDTCLRKPLSQIPRETLMLLIDKVNSLYDKHINDSITTLPERPIHKAVLEEFSESDRTESSLRHLRQASRLLWLAEDEGLVEDRTCYVELGAGKGQMSYYAGQAWCESSSKVLLVDRASLRHKRDNRLRDRSVRIRADLAHLALEKVPVVEDCCAVVGLAKHLCGVATDYALRCLTAGGAVSLCRGCVLATCCHHRCDRAGYIANAQLQEVGISGDEMNAMLGIVSWATCGDGRSREHRNQAQKDNGQSTNSEGPKIDSSIEESGSKDQSTGAQDQELNSKVTQEVKEQVLSQELRTQVGRKAKALLDWGRVLYLREKGFEARLCYYVPSTVSLENVCIVAKKLAEM